MSAAGAMARRERRLEEALEGKFTEHLHPRNRHGEWAKKLGGAINFHGSGDTAVLKGPKKTYGAVAKLAGGKFGAEHDGTHLGEHPTFDAAAEAVAKAHVEKHGAAPEEKIPGATAIVKGKAGRFVKLNGKQVHVPHHDDFSRKVGADTFTSPKGTTAVYKNDAPYNAPKGVAQNKLEQFPKAGEKLPSGYTPEALAHEKATAPTPQPKGGLAADPSKLSDADLQAAIDLTKKKGHTDALAGLQAEKTKRGLAAKGKPPADFVAKMQAAHGEALSQGLGKNLTTADGSKFKSLKGTKGAVDVLTTKDGKPLGAAATQFGEHIATYGSKILGKHSSKEEAKAAVLAHHEGVLKGADKPRVAPVGTLWSGNSLKTTAAKVGESGIIGSVVPTDGKFVAYHHPSSKEATKLGTFDSEPEAQKAIVAAYRAAPPKAGKSEMTEEQAAKASVPDLLAAVDPKAFLDKFDNPNGGKRSPAEAALAKAITKELYGSGYHTVTGTETSKTWDAVKAAAAGGGSSEPAAAIPSKATLKADILSRLEEKGGRQHTTGLKYETGGHGGGAGVSQAWDDAAKSLEAEGKIKKESTPLGEHYVLAGSKTDKGGPIPSYDGVTLTGAKAAGGSTGAQITQGSDGKKYLVKTYGGDQDRVATELAANAIYRALGVKVPEAGTKDNGGKSALVYPLLDGSPTKIKEPSAELGKHFMTDALVANWDFIGLTDDNILWDKKGSPFRVDQGGTLQYRAQGSKKTFGSIPGEVETMLSGGGQGVGKVKVSEEQKKEQAAQIAKTLTPDKIDAIMKAAPFADEKMRSEVTAALKGRVAWMAKYATGDKTAAQALASAASEQSKPSTPAGVAKAAEILGAKPKDVADFKAAASPSDLTKALQSELAKAGKPSASAASAPSFQMGDQKMASPARSPSGNLRNFKSMGDVKLMGVWNDINAFNDGADDPDSEAHDAIKAEMDKRGISTAGASTFPKVSAPQASAAATVKPPPAAIGGSKQPKPELVGSPGRGPSGALRNFQSMSDSKLAKTLLDLVAHGGDPEALHAAQLEAIKRRPNVKLKEAIEMAEASLDGLIEADYSSSERSKMAKDGRALPDGSFPIDSEQDVHNAMSLLHHAKDQGKARAHIKKRAAALGVKVPSLQAQESALERRVAKRIAVFEAADSLAKASTPEPFSKSKTSNWVARGGGLPAYIQHIAHDLVEKRGKTESEAIQMAIGIVKRWARGGGNVDAGTRAAASKAVAEWEALKSKNKAS